MAIAFCVLHDTGTGDVERVLVVSNHVNGLESVKGRETRIAQKSFARVESKKSYEKFQKDAIIITK